jgi:hypothetical protein
MAGFLQDQKTRRLYGSASATLGRLRRHQRRAFPAFVVDANSGPRTCRASAARPSVSEVCATSIDEIGRSARGLRKLGQRDPMSGAGGLHELGQRDPTSGAGVCTSSVNEIRRAVPEVSASSIHAIDGFMRMFVFAIQAVRVLVLSENSLRCQLGTCSAASTLRAHSRIDSSMGAAAPTRDGSPIKCFAAAKLLRQNSECSDGHWIEFTQTIATSRGSL